MRKGTYRQRAYIKAAICAVAALMACASCVYDDYADTAAGSDNTVNVSLTIRTASMAATRSDDDYVEGSTYENYIDLDGGDYRVYFFTNDPDNDGNDTYLATFEPIKGVAYYGTNYTSYFLYGSVPAEEMINETDFKIMVLANLGTYDDTKLVAGTTTIDDVCSATWTEFNALTDCALSEDNLIPFYGIHAYTGYSFALNEVVELKESITLLRAMAKVEVVMVDDDGYTFSNVVITHNNAKGYCAPANVYSQDDYGQGDDWDNDYLKDLHLVNNGENDTNSINNSISFTHIDDAENDTWVAYMPEYKNQGDKASDSYIEATLNGGVHEEDTYTIYFAEYDDDGTLESYTADNCYNIQRNNLYRFTVSLKKESLDVHVDKWDDMFENKFEFGVSSQEEDEITEDEN